MKEMRTKILLLLLVVLSFSSIAQDKQLTMKEAVRGYHLYPKSIKQLKWIPETKTYTFVEKSDVKVQSVKGKSKVLFNLETLNKALVAKEQKELKALPYFGYESKYVIRFRANQSYVFYNYKTKQVVSIVGYNKAASGVEYSKANGYLAYTIDNGLYIQKTKEIAVATSDDKNIIYGQTVSRNEFGISDGVFWSPKGTSLAFYRKDESKVSNYPIVDVSTRVAEVKNTKYPMAGLPSEHITLGVYNLKNQKTIYLKTNPKSEEYLTNVSWGPEDKFIYIQVLNRGQNHMWFNKYDAATGELVKTLFEETHDKYVEPEHEITFFKKQKNTFIYQTDKDGYNHMYLYKTDGTFVKQITTGKWVVTSLLGFDNSEKFVYFVSTKDGVLNRNLYKVEIKTGKVSRITKGDGVHNPSLSSDKSLVIDNYSNLTTPRIINIIDSKGRVKKNLLTSKNPLKDYAECKTELFAVNSTDGATDLHCRMITPPNMDKTKKYPVIVYVYGGPHSQMISNRWLAGGNLWFHYLAQKGYIIFTLDNRGTNFRGRDFENIIHRQCGQIEMQDQMAGVKHLKTLPYVDADRIGVNGWSYGGFMTTSLMVNYPETFKVGVAGGPVIDWKFYEAMYGERYMDTPKENPEGYAKTSLLSRAKDLKDNRLLVIHGAIDPVVVWQHSLTFVRECVKEGVQLDYFAYPRHEHNVSGVDRIHLREKVTRYFDDFLK